MRCHAFCRRPSPSSPTALSTCTTCSTLDSVAIVVADVFPLPTLSLRHEQVMASKMTLGGDVDFQQIAKKTPGFVGADLSSLTKEAAVVAINRIFTRLRATSPPPSGPSTAVSTAVAVGSSSTALPISKPHEALGNGSLSGAAGGEAVAVAPTTPGTMVKASLPAATATNERTSDDDGGVASGGGGGGCAGAEEGAEAVGGFLAGPLSAAQLAPLSVTMEDFLMAVKKVKCDMCGVRCWMAHGFLGVLDVRGTRVRTILNRFFAVWCVHLSLLRLEIEVFVCYC